MLLSYVDRAENGRSWNRGLSRGDYDYDDGHDIFPIDLFCSLS